MATMYGYRSKLIGPEKKWISMYEYKRMVRLKGHQIRISNHVRLQVQINWTRKDRYPCTDTLNCNTKT